MEPDGEQNAFLEYPGFHPLVADGAEVDRLKLRELPDILLGEEFSGRKVTLRPDVEVGPGDVKPIPLPCGVENLSSCDDDLGTDAVPAYRRYSVLHVFTSSRFFA
ncbi:hypothetical protein DSECCO2_612950 [anaerobic digester metagenome]